ncbi:MAG: DNA replication/repair protein RecF [Chloroherpetonaceae bacterium]|nr:DNA replication/repair protein RecF [Chthonomonadaceae bacterium]MDW8208019.1 DNA replication/repair protein RecF [Chloroherpetonaceae bacterium]
MRVCQLKLHCFRNYRDLTLDPGEGLNILHGENAQGKTNILEAIFLLATTRSPRVSRDSELIHHGAEAAHVTAEIEREQEGDAELQISVQQGDRKTVRINGMKRERVLDLLGQFNAVSFGAIDLKIITGEPADRRHFLNVEISQVSPRYVYDLGHYKRVLANRNRLLKDLRERPRYIEESGLDAWDEQLICYGTRLLQKRQFYIERLSPLADQVQRELTDGKEGLEIQYVPSFPLPSNLPVEERKASTSDSTVAVNLNDTEAVAQRFREQLIACRMEEIRRGTTLIGPQRDDLCFRINGADARIYGSQGQQRTVVLALKLAEFQLIQNLVGEPPVMLLDDVMSDLDDARRQHLLRWVQRRCQTFLTCTSLNAFPKEILAGARTFCVVAGTVTPDARGKTEKTARSRRKEQPVEEIASNGVRATS